MVLSKARKAGVLASEMVGLTSAFFDYAGYTAMARDWVNPAIRPLLPFVTIGAFIIALWIIRTRRPLL
ncbi:MAG TPA: hypothetical protein VL284_00425, partial [Thermoanaerobaculia bacterium]|nr:hypothetical protein [Thermoanaerobaculia bacterium]